LGCDKSVALAPLRAPRPQARDMVARKPLAPFPHRRSPWRGDETVFVCTRWGLLNGQELGLGALERRSIYQASKFDGNHDAAQRIVSECVSDRVVDRLIDATERHMQRGVPIVCVL
jgi:hypothetical protein